MKQTSVLLLLILSAFFSLSIGQTKPDENQLSAYQELNTMYQNMFEISWGKETGTPNIISFSSPVAFDNTPEKSAVNLFLQFRNMIKYRSGIDTLVLFKQREHDGSKFFHYEQKFKGVRVNGGEYCVTVLPDSRVQLVLGAFYKDIELNINPGISLETALEIAQKNLSAISGQKDSILTSEIIIFPQAGKYYLAYEFNIRMASAESWNYIIDASSGEVLKSRSNQSSSQANVYKRNPNAANYVTVSPVQRLNNNGYLQGTYVNVVNDETDEAYNANNDFRYIPSNTHFDEANLYYLIDTFRVNYINNFGFNGFTQITAHAHHIFDDNVPDAQYGFADQQLYFSDGQEMAGYNSFAREDKIVYHEYVHAVMANIAFVSSDPLEEGAISEGVADYFAGSFVNRDSIGVYVCPSGTIRIMSNPRIATYDQYLQYAGYPTIECHIGGEFLSSCLWNLRNSLGQTIADKIIYDGLYSLSSTTNFLGIRQAIIDAAIRDNYGCGTVNTIRNVFYLKGIGDDAYTVTSTGTLQNNETWYCTSLQGNVYVPTGKTLTIGYNAAVYLNSYSILSTGGTIVKDGSATISGLKATLTHSTSGLKGYFGTVQAAVNEITNNDYGYSYELALNGSSSESISLTNKYGVHFYGTGSNSISGTLSATNCESCTFNSFTASKITLSGCTLPYLHNISVTTVSGNESIYAYNCTNLSYSGGTITYTYGNGITAYQSSTTTINENSGTTLFFNSNRGIVAQSGATVDIDNVHFCSNNTYDLVANSGTSITADYCWFLNSTPLTSGSVTTSSNQSYTACASMGKKTASSLLVSSSEDDPAKDELTLINDKNFELGQKIREDVECNGSYDAEKYRGSYTDVVDSYNNFINKYPSSEYAKTALVSAVHIYRTLKDYEGMNSFLQTIIGNNNLAGESSLAKRFMIEYYTAEKDYTSAIKTADEIISTKDADLICDALYAKGNLYQYSLDSKDKAIECYQQILKEYPENSLVTLAETELGFWGVTVEQNKKEIATESKADVSNEFGSSNYPNPFNPTTTINYTIPEAGLVQIKVFDSLGRELSTLLNDEVSAGRHTLEWNGSNYSSGIYFYSISYKGQMLYKKMLLVK